MPPPTIYTTPNDRFAELLAVSQEGRCRTPRHIQHQLLSLHDSLRTHAEEIRNAIHQDSGAGVEETDIEFAMAMAVVRRLYSRIYFRRRLDVEFNISRGKDDAAARVPFGMAFIRPTTHTRFFSIITAAATAIAAGNVVILELEDSRRLIDAFFMRHLNVYDSESFAIATCRVVNATFLEKCLIVDQTASSTISAMSLPHCKDHVAVAVVDRSADINQAAEAIIRSRLAFNGMSPFAVDLVLVSEWARDDFIACCEARLAKNAGPNEKSCTRREYERTSNGYTKGPVPNVHGLAILEVPRTSEPLSLEYTADTLHLLTFSGLVDAALVASTLSPLLVLYCFSDAGSAKYLGQYVDSPLCVVNQVPNTLLVGPPLPLTSHVADLSMRYDTDMMSRPSPRLIQPVDTPPDRLYRDEMFPLKRFKQGSGWDIGFFPRAILTGLFTVGLPSLALLSYGFYRIVKISVTFSILDRTLSLSCNKIRLHLRDKTNLQGQGI